MMIVFAWSFPTGCGIAAGATRRPIDTFDACTDRSKRSYESLSSFVTTTRIINISRMYMQNGRSKDDDDAASSFTLVDKYAPLLNQRISHLQARILEQQLTKPPNPSLSPIQFITAILQELLEQHSKHENNNRGSMKNIDMDISFLPDSGYRTLIRSSTDRWKEQLCESIGAKSIHTNNNNTSNTLSSSSSSNINEEQLVSALSAAMSRPNNQYQILCPDYDNKNDDNYTQENYHLYFPNDVFEYDEGKVWVESQLRHPKTGKLLAILAWSLVQRESDNAWLIDWLDWQDFRDEFRPGIGREEWPRICG